MRAFYIRHCLRKRMQYPAPIGLLFVFIFLTAAMPFAGQAQVASGDSLALVGLYNSTHGAGWANKTNWLTKAPVGKWFGVTVHNNRVDTVKLSSNSLTGVLPPQLAKLTGLVRLDLDDNKLGGSLPQALESLTKLKRLNISANQFTFAGLEGLVRAFGDSVAFYYAPQAPLTLQKKGNSFWVSAGGTPANDTFRLYKGTGLVKTQVGDSVFTATAAGIYYITVTNAVARQLKLSSTTATYTPPPSITIAANPGLAICQGTKVTFVAAVANTVGGAIYQWKKDGKKVGGNSVTYTDSLLKTGDSIVCVYTGGGDTAKSNLLVMAVKPLATPLVYITASTTGIICKGTAVIFTAHAYPGDTIAYRWKKNGKAVGTNSKNYVDSTLKAGDSVYVVIKSYAACLAVDTAVSKAIKLAVVTPAVPIVTITANKGTTICKGTIVTFTAHATGDSIAYRWKKNGKSVGANSKEYVDSTLKTGDSVYVVIKSYASCLAVDTAVSKAIKFTVGVSAVPSITITSAQGDTICKKTLVILKALVANTSGTVVFEWKKDGRIVGKDSVAYTDSTLVNGDSITCTIVFKGLCIADSIVVSKTIKFTVIEAPALPSTIKGPETVKADTVVGYKVNAEPGAKFVWYVPASSSIIAGQGTDSITVKWGKDSGRADIAVEAYNKCGFSERVSKVVSVTLEAVVLPVDNKFVPLMQPLRALLYPNPAATDANLQISGGAADKVLVTVTDLAGKLLWHGEFTANTQVALPSGNLPAGVYLVKVASGKETTTLKLVKGN